MTEIELLSRFFRVAVLPIRVRRYTALIESKKGRGKFLTALAHNLEADLRPNIDKPAALAEAQARPCLIFSAQVGFGEPRESVSVAYEELANEDSWLIITEDGSFGMHRAEARWDAQVCVKL